MSNVYAYGVFTDTFFEEVRFPLEEDGRRPRERVAAP
jgi:hypothetical protein